MPVLTGSTRLGACDRWAKQLAASPEQDAGTSPPHPPPLHPQLHPWGPPHLSPTLRGETLRHPHCKEGPVPTDASHTAGSTVPQFPSPTPLRLHHPVLQGERGCLGGWWWWGGGCMCVCGPVSSNTPPPPWVLPPPRHLRRRELQTAALRCGFGLALTPPHPPSGGSRAFAWGARPGLNWVLPETGAPWGA